MTQQLRTLILTVDFSSVSRTYIVLDNNLTPVSWDLMTYSLLQGYCTHLVHMHACRQKHLFIQIKNKCIYVENREQLRHPISTSHLYMHVYCNPTPSPFHMHIIYAFETSMCATRFICCICVCFVCQHAQAYRRKAMFHKHYGRKSYSYIYPGIKYHEYFKAYFISLSWMVQCLTQMYVFIFFLSSLCLGFIHNLRSVAIIYSLFQPLFF